ncbi:MAG TPA: NAD(P)-binding domain-containing protein, partial [Chitinophagaceae bacterium]|nr:NAD(P)-binding domain-containing protein [Chitinophagaceae bacterium]
MTFGIIGSGSWATALAKILTDKKHAINWWIRDEKSIRHIRERNHNPRYLSSASFDTSLLFMTSNVKEVVERSEVIIIAVPSAFVEESLAALTAGDWKDKKVISAIKGLLPDK